MRTEALKAQAMSVDEVVQDEMQARHPGLGSPSTSLLERLRGDLERAVSATFDATGPRFRTSFGVGFDFQDGAKDVFEFSSAGKQSLESSVRKSVV